MLNCHKSIPAVHFCFLTFWHWGHYQSPFFQHDGHNLSQTVEDTNFLKVFWNLGLICCFWCQNDTMVHYIYWTCHLMKDLHFHFWHLYSIFFLSPVYGSPWQGGVLNEISLPCWRFVSLSQLFYHYAKLNILH